MISAELPDSCRAMVLTGDRRLEQRRLPLPRRFEPGQLLLAVEGCGICGSDIEQFEGALAKKGVVRYPVIPGHEPVGRVAAIDAQTAARRGLAVGDRVAVHGSVPCGVCHACTRGLRCIDAFHYGFRPLDVGCGLWGGYGEYMLIEPSTRLYRLPADIGVEDAVLFNPLAAGFDWVIRQARTEVGDTVLILGPGQRGLASVIAAREAGAAHIVVTGLARDARKLALARELGADVTLVADDTDIVEAVLDLTGGRGADRVIDTTPQAFKPVEDAVACARKGGVVVLAGLKAELHMPHFPLDAVIHKQLQLVGALASGDWSVAQAIRVAAAGRHPLHLLHSHTLPLEEAAHAIEMLAGQVPGETPIHITLVTGLTP